MQSCAQTIRRVFKVIYIYIYRQNGLEPVKVRKKNQQYQHLQHSSMFT